MDGISQVSGQNVSQSTQIYALKKSREATAQTVMSLVNDAAKVADNIRANPPHLGQSVDVRA